MATEVNQRLILVPESDISSQYSVLQLKHPRTNSKALCALNSSHKLYEIVHFADDFSSWFVEDSVIQDGSLYILTAVDPLFFMLPYVSDSGKFCPLDDLFIDENYPDAHHLVKCCSSVELLNIFDMKESSGYKVFCYNNTKTLHWLQQKVNHLSSTLKNTSVNISDGSKSSALHVDNKEENPELLKSYACHLVSEYISENVASELFKVLGLEIKKGKRKLENNAQETSKKQNTSVSPTEDYSKRYSLNTVETKQKSKMSAAQKQLLKVDKKGMKSISSFFQKK